MNILKDNKLAFLDFEFCRSSHPQLCLVSGSIMVDGKIESWWLKNDEHQHVSIADYIDKLRDDGRIFVAYGATAECRSFMALGLDPHNYRWIDLYFEWRQLTHTCNKYKYGVYFDKAGIKQISEPPHYEKSRNKGKDNKEIGKSYVAAVGLLLEKYVDSVHKDTMRDLILSDLPEYTEQQKNDIIKYCDSDLYYLPELLEKMFSGLIEATTMTPEKTLAVMMYRGDFSSSLAKMEQEGFPIEFDKIKNLRRNFPLVKENLIELLNETYPFYIREKKTLKEFRGTYTKKYSQFEKFLQECPLINEKLWPLTPTDSYKMDEETLDKYLGIPEIKDFKDTNKAIGQLRWFNAPKPDDEDPVDFFDNVGPDLKLRAFLGGFGTQTGRNAPRAKSFILAMSKWLRCLIRPPKGESIVAIDYGAQEFAIAAIKSKDVGMIEAYASGDPYLYFAIMAGAIPPGGTKQTHPEERNLFKSTILGVQYGMGYKSLALKLTVDCGRFVSEEEALKLINFHKRIYPTYWVWLETQLGMYQLRHNLVLWDGWALLDNQDNGLSVKNFPVQGTGGVIMRRAVYLAHQKGIRILAPLHDAIYAIFNDKTESHHPDILSQCMQQAVEDVLGEGVVIRQDREIHDHEHTWVEEEGEKFYHLLKGYLEPMETTEDVDQILEGGMFAAPVYA